MDYSNLGPPPPSLSLSLSFPLFLFRSLPRLTPLLSQNKEQTLLRNKCRVNVAGALLDLKLALPLELYWLIMTTGWNDLACHRHEKPEAQEGAGWRPGVYLTPSTITIEEQP